jgi:aminoglycoside phosphotransferase (APT) family kinase protein
MSTDLADRLGTLLHSRVEGLVRLSGGASRETWSFDSVDPRSGARRELILRRDPPGAARGDGMELEARLLTAAAKAGVPVPGVRAAGPADPARLDTSYLIMDRIAGETIARKILRDPEYGTARTLLAGQGGEALARLHRIDPATVHGLEFSDPLVRYRSTYDQLSEALATRVPVFEWAFAWLQEHRPQGRPQTVVHGDFRLGNVIVNSDGLAAVLDWELAHLGDPMEDLGWLCVKAWRFGGAPEVGGFGTLDELIAGYERGGGVADRAVVQWWIVAGTLMWGVMCMLQANAHLSGALRSVELAAIGRRVPEQEHDLLLLLAPEELAAAKATHAASAQSARAASGTMSFSDEFGLPSAAALVDAVRHYIENDVMVNTTGRTQFHGRVASNVLAMVARQLSAMSPHVAAADQLATVDQPASISALASQLVARLAVANPKYLEG